MPVAARPMPVAARPMPVAARPMPVAARPAPAVAEPTRDQVAVLDAGRTAGGCRNLAFTVSTDNAPDIGTFTYRAELRSRTYGAPDTEEWTTRAELSGTGHAPQPLRVTFEAVDLPPGLQRLRLRLNLRLAESRPRTPELELGLEAVPAPSFTGPATAERRRS
jgi:hypothetical protein